MGALWPGGPVELPARFTVDGEQFTLPAIPTVRLLYWLGADAWRQLVPWVLPEQDRAWFLHRLADKRDRFDRDNLWAINSRLFGRLANTAGEETGDGYFPAVRIAGSLLGNWMVFEAWCARHGFRPLEAPLHTVISAGYSVLMEACTDEAEQNSTRARIWAPPPRMVPGMREANRAREAAMARAILEDDELLPGE